MLPTLRRATEADFALLWSLHVATMKEYVAETWGWDDAVQQRMFHERRKTLLGVNVICLDGKDIGWLHVRRESDAIHIDTIAIHPSHQRQGFGTSILHELIAEADRSRLPVRLQFLKVNPVRRLYERLGFRISGETSSHYQMERPFDSPLKSPIIAT